LTRFLFKWFPQKAYSTKKEKIKYIVGKKVKFFITKHYIKANEEPKEIE